VVLVEWIVRGVVVFLLLLVCVEVLDGGRWEP